VPIVAHNELPTFERLRSEGQNILPSHRAIHQDIRELHIGLLNMMPDAAVAATERQFFRLVGQSNQIAQFYVHPFSLPGLPRGEQARAHVERFYQSFEAVRKDGLDALIITGANVSGPELDSQPFWQPLIEVVDWALESVTSTLCSCLATHAVMQFRYGQRRRPLPAKRWGVYTHRVVDQSHPLNSSTNTRFDVPHSRFNEVSREQFEAVGARVLVESAEAGVHLATSPDGLRIVMFQGHPEYDTISLLKEYKREVRRFSSGARVDYPPFPEHIFSRKAMAVLDEYRHMLERALDRGREPPPFPEERIASGLDNTWRDTAEGVIGNWLGLIYRLTHKDRRIPFMDQVDPENPLQGIVGV
jgi:homoserine O-succinyltransferase